MGGWAWTAVAAVWLAAPGLRGFDLITDESRIYAVTWPRGPVSMVNSLDDTAVLSDGTTAHDSVEVALADWNARLGNVQFTSSSGPVGSFAVGNGVNEIVVSGSVAGVYTFGASTLAVTLSFRDGNHRTESDVIFNQAFTWDSYRGSLRSGAHDLRRVALHELGHALGLDHPDQATPPQVVTALMNSTVSGVDALQSDDIAGGHFLYGAPEAPPANDDFAQATPIVLDGTGRASVNGTTVQSGSEPGEPVLDPDYPSGRSAWWRVTVPAAGLLNVTTLGSRFDTFLGAFTGTAVDALTLIDRNDDVDPGVIRTSTLSFRVAAGTTYHLMVDGWDGYEGGVQLNLSLLADPVLTATMVSPRQVGERGQALTLGVTATAVQGGALSYQWHRNNRPLAGATGPELTLPGFRNADAGSYHVVVSEAGGETVRGLAYVLPDRDATALVAWGGADTDGRRQVPDFGQPVLQVALGGAHGLALRRDGTVVGWGSPTGFDAHGQEQVPAGLADVVAVAAGDRHSLALRADGTVVAWGSNDYGQSLVPWDLREVVAIAAGSYYSAALRADGAVVLWGYAVEPGGELAVPDDVSGVVRLAGGPHLVVAEGADGTVWAWGDPNDGKLNVPTLPPLADLSAGFGHVLAAGQDGLVTAWGANDAGESDVPAGLAGVTAVAAGVEFSLALRDDHTVAAWGATSNGQTAVPAGLDRVVQLATARATSVALRDLSAPVIVSATAAPTVTYGENATLSVAALGTGLSYQWYAGESGDTTAPLAGATAAALTIAPETTTAYWVRVSDGLTSVDGGTQVVTVTPVAPVIVTPPVAMAFAEPLSRSLRVGVVGSPPLTYTWSHQGVALVGDVGDTLSLPGFPALTGAYAVTIGNSVGSVTSEPVWVAVLPAGRTERVAHTAERTPGDGALSNDTWRVAGRAEWLGATTAVSWETLVPAGWTVVDDAEAAPAAASQPTVGEASVAAWSWPDGPAVTVTTGLRLAAATPFAGTVEVSSLVTLTRADGTTEVLADPDPLRLRSSRHSADTDGDRRLDLNELLRVIELYNTRVGMERTGDHHRAVGTEDGFAPGTSPVETPAGHHSADVDRDGRLSLSELLRVIELYNTRSGTARTGAYQVDGDGVTADGFAPER